MCTPPELRGTIDGIVPRYPRAVDGAAMLSGPRGRRFCAEVACAGHDEVRGAYYTTAWSPNDDAARQRFVMVLSETVPEVDEDTLLPCLADAVAQALYWQPPAQEDIVLTDPRVVEALRPVADAVVGSPTWRLWTSGLDIHAQAHVRWTGDHPTDAPRLTGIADGLREWRRETLENERSAYEWPDDPTAPWSGHWWSTPVWGRAVATSPARPGLGATQLMLVEDSLGWTEARVSPLRPSPGARVYEVDGTETWVDLVNRYPLEVTRSRRHDWWRTTGRTGRWFIPDWHAVAAGYDAVHLTVAAYLATPGRALDVEGGATVLAGWDPDVTFWLADVLVPAGETVDWERVPGSDRWRPRS
jgi:hypothetical protein